jgi:hypothetical protein
LIGEKGKENARLSRNDGETVNVSTNNELDNVVLLEGLLSSLLVTGDGGEVLENVVDGNGGGESDT